MAKTPFNARHGLTVNGAMTISASNGEILIGANVSINTTAICIGNSTVNAIINSTSLSTGGEQIVSAPKTDGGQFRSIGGNYGVFQRNDGSNFYYLITASANQYGTWNSLRPLYFDLATGYISFQNGLMSINTTAAAVGANVVMTPTNIFVGNSTVNSSANSTVMYSGAFNTVSDKRLKKNIKDAPKGVDSLRPRQFVYKSAPEKTRYGFVAQEVSEYFPSLVTEHDDGTLSLNYNDIIAIHLQDYLDSKKLISTLQKRIEKLEKANG